MTDKRANKRCTCKRWPADHVYNPNTCPPAHPLPLPLPKGGFLAEQAVKDYIGSPIYNHDPEKGGIKHDSDKPRMELIPPEFLAGISEVLTHGAKKYDDWNWAKGMSWLRVYGALQRHLVLGWAACVDYDDETGRLHLEHAACCLMFLHYYQVNEKGTDDRHRR
jgi:hypothetical protein